MLQMPKSGDVAGKSGIVKLPEEHRLHPGERQHCAPPCSQQKAGAGEVIETLQKQIRIGAR